MARPIRIADLETRIRWLADQERAELRHTSADLRKEASQSIQRFRELFSDNGHTYFLKHHTGTLPAGNTVSDQDSTVEFPWGSVDLSDVYPSMSTIYGVEIRYNGTTENLTPVSFQERNDFDDQNVLGIPVRFMVYDETTMAFMPAPGSAYKFTIWYLPVVPDLLNDDDEFDPGVPGGEQWVIWDVILKILQRDNYPDLYGMAKTEKSQLETELLYSANRRQRVGPGYRLDTRGRKRGAVRRLLYSGTNLP